MKFSINAKHGQKENAECINVKLFDVITWKNAYEPLLTCCVKCTLDVFRFKNYSLYLHMISSFFSEIQHGLRNLLKSYNAELIKNKTAEQYLFNRDAGDRDYVLEVMLPTLLCK